jgi:hypothetical protein
MPAATTAGEPGKAAAAVYAAQYRGRREMTDGWRLSQAWKSWIASVRGKKLSEGTASGVYLKNRLEAAFNAGYLAAEKEFSEAEK